MENKGPEFVYTEEQLMARLKFFIGVCLALTLTGIVFVVLYSIIFVTQPLNAISPIDQKFFELIVPIATFLTGTLSGIMLSGAKKEDQEAMLAAQKNAQIAADSAKAPVKTEVSFSSTSPSMMPPMGMMGGGMMSGGMMNAGMEQHGQVVTGFGGKPAPVQAPQPLL